MTDTNIWRKIALIAGGVISLILVVFNIYHAFRVSEGFSFTQGLLPELLSVVLVAIVFLLPTFALCKRKELDPVLSKIGVLYPILVGLGFLNILFSDDPLAAGVPMVLVVAPFCIIYGLVVLVKGKKG